MGNYKSFKAVPPAGVQPSSASLLKVSTPVRSSAGYLHSLLFKTLNHVCKSLLHKDLKANGNFLDGRAAPGQKTHRGGCERSSCCRGTLCLLQQQRLTPTLVQHALIFKNIQSTSTSPVPFIFLMASPGREIRENPNCSSGAKSQEPLQPLTRGQLWGFFCLKHNF